MNACGPSEEEIRRQEEARQDSLEQVRQDSLERVRQDSIEQARQDSIAAARERERNRIEYVENGQFTVQVGAWRSEAKAQQQVSKWKERGFEQAYVVRGGDESTGNVWFRIRVGQVSTLEMAEKLRTKLMEEHNTEAWISNASGDSVD